MLTKFEMRILDFIATLSSKFFTVPFTWENGIISMKSNQWVVYNLATWLIILPASVWRITQLWAAIGNQNAIIDSILNGLFVLISLGHLIFKLNTWIYKAELVRLMNQALKANSRWGEKFLRLQFTESKKRETAFFSAMSGVTFLALLLYIAMLVTRNELYSSYQLVANDYHWTCHYAALLTFAAAEAFMMADRVANFHLNATCLYLSCLSMRFWLNQICVGWPEPKGTSDEEAKEPGTTETLVNVECDEPMDADLSGDNETIEPLTVEERITLYRGMYIMSTDFNMGFGKLFIPFVKWGLLIGIVVSFFGIVRLHSKLGVLGLTTVSSMTICAALFAVPISFVMSSLFDLSQRFLLIIFPRISDIKYDRKGKKYVEGQLKSCAVIRCQVGGLYYMEGQAKLTMMDYIVQGIVFLLVNFRV